MVLRVESPAAVPATPASSPATGRASAAVAVPMRSPGPVPVAIPLRSSVQRRPYTPYLSAEQLIAASPIRKKGFDLDSLTRAGTAQRATNSERPYSAASLGFDAPTTLSAKELSAAIGKMDLRPLKRAGIVPTACFDFDNTLARGDVFFEFCELLLARTSFPNHNRKRVGDILVATSNGRVSKADLAGKNTDAIMRRALAMGETGKLEHATVFFMLIAALRGMNVRDVTAIAEELFEKGAPGREPYKNHFFSQDGVGSIELCKALKAKGIEPHIITLGLPIVVRIGARYLGIAPEHVHGSELEVKNGKFTGYAIDAAIVGKHTIADNEVSRTPLLCFGDTLGSDAPMLSRATVRSFVVNPRPDFRAHILENNADLNALIYAT